MAFSPPVVGCLVKKGLQKGGHRHPRTPLAMPMHLYTSHYCMSSNEHESYWYILLSWLGFRVGVTVLFVKKEYRSVTN